MWSDIEQGIDGSFRIFQHIVNVYEQLALIDLKCEHREISYTIRNQIISGKGFFPSLQIVELIESFFLFWYGVNWH